MNIKAMISYTIGAVKCRFKGHTYADAVSCPFTGKTYRGCSRCGITVVV